MCMGATCSKCSKRSWRGCGSHIPSALQGVPEDQWCDCDPKVMVNGKAYPPAAPFEIPGAAWISSWFGTSENKAQGSKGKEDL